MKISRSLLTYVDTEKEHRIIEARIVTTSNNEASKLIGIPRRTVDRAVNRVIERAMLEGFDASASQPKVLIMDIETAPMLAYLWSLWQHGVSLNAMEHTSYVLCWAAKWLGDDEVMSDALCFDDDYEAGYEDDHRMIEGIWDLLDEADFVVAHNGDKFDIKRLNTRFVLAGMPRPNPYKSIDTLKIVKRCFAFDSNKLEHLLQEFFGYGKDDVGGMETWIACLKGDPYAWEKMISYNESDVTKLEELYLKIRHWDHLHPSAATNSQLRDVPVCTVCASTDIVATGHTVSTGVSVFNTHRCNDCGNVMRERSSIVSKSVKQSLLVGVK